ncbi:alpha/beta hydrolase fold domain-containing protein [Bacteroidota bacterium]
MKQIILILLTIVCSLLNAQIRKYSDLDYIPDGHPKHKLDIYLPEQPKFDIPLVVWIHGGAWISGDKTPLPVHASYLLEHGFAVASINYRFASEIKFPAQIFDCKAAIRWLRANSGTYNINSDRIGVWGSSAGGHLVSLLGTSCDIEFLEGNLGNTEYSSCVQAVCNYFGPVDFINMPGNDNPDSHLGKLIGGSIEDFMEEYIEASPVTYIDETDPPFLSVHGTEDPLVPYQQSITLDSMLNIFDIESTLILIDGAKHGGAEFQTDTLLNQITEFFNRHLKTNSGVNELVEFNSGISALPNPFSDFTNINFNLDKNSNVRLSLFNSLGHEVSVIIDKYLTTGNHLVIIDIPNLSQGLYFFRLQTDDKIQSGRLIKMK